jgi:hypothetical protein
LDTLLADPLGLLSDIFLYHMIDAVLLPPTQPERSARHLTVRQPDRWPI